ncbi:hypothetical protein BLOT_010243 [Blomia tropicalis]|nr:hypothetical protein BLOT_010243 [Blomia tropicalis]
MLQQIIQLDSIGYQNILWLLASLIAFTYWYSTRNYNYWKNQGIDGPAPTPFLGSFFNIRVPMPISQMDQVRKYGKIFGIYMGSKPQLMISDPKLIKQIVVSDFHMFRNRPDNRVSHKIFGENLVRSRDDNWKRIRSILTPMFTSSKLKKMESLMDDCVVSMLKWMDGTAKRSETFEAKDSMGAFTMDVIAKCAFATETDAQTTKAEENAFIKNSKALFSVNRLRMVAQMIVPKFIQRYCMDNNIRPFYVQEFDFFENITRHLIKERRMNPDKHQDMLQLMVNAEHNTEMLDKTYKEELANAVDGHHVNSGNEELEQEHEQFRNIIGSKYLSEAEVMAQAMVFFLAGYETTASTLSFCLHELAHNQDIQQRLYEEIQRYKEEDPKLQSTTLTKMDYLDAVLSETLRKYPPALLIGREAGQDYPIPGTNITLKKGQAVNFPIYAMHHMEEYFPDPERFNPERFTMENRHKIIPYTYFPFGGGPRNCIGMRFALTEAKMALANLIDNFIIIPGDGATKQLNIEIGFILLKTSPILLKVKARSK